MLRTRDKDRALRQRVADAETSATNAPRPHLTPQDSARSKLRLRKVSAGSSQLCRRPGCSELGQSATGQSRDAIIACNSMDYPVLTISAGVSTHPLPRLDATTSGDSRSTVLSPRIGAPDDFLGVGGLQVCGVRSALRLVVQPQCLQYRRHSWSGLKLRGVAALKWELGVRCYNAGVAEAMANWL